MNSHISALFFCTALSALTPIFTHAGDAVYHPIPSKAQLNWQDMEMYAFVHFTTNTFTDKEWGYGDESPDIFAPTDYSPEQIIKTLAEAGFKGVVLTCKHHDGFCLWPTKTTKHSVAFSSWKNGKGDVVRDFSNACRKYNVKFGIYVSPWDRNHPNYGTPSYLKAYRQQLRELLTNYGPIFMTWHDGANGGDGYYGGKKEKRSIDRSTYYDWKNTWNGIKKYQPEAVIFSDVGPDVRWIGNEHGEAGYPCWATYTPRSNNGSSDPAPGVVHYQDGQNGTANGKFWIPAEVDVSIRPGWFWHAAENTRVRTPENLLKLYFESVGRGANLNLNVPPDRRGRIHEADQASLKEFSRLIKQLYSQNYADGATVSTKDGKKGSSPKNILNRTRTSYWISKKDIKKAELLITLPEKRSFDIVRLAEPTQLGQRIRKFSIQHKTEGGWQPWLSGSSIGSRVILQGNMIETDQLKLSIDEADAPPALSEFSLWKKPQIIPSPDIQFDRNGIVTISNNNGKIFYSLDGSEPSETTIPYSGPFPLAKGGLVTAAAFLKGSSSALRALQVPLPTANWKIIKAENTVSDPYRMLDGDFSTIWHTHAENREIAPPQNIDIDMGQDILVSKVFYTPRQDGNTKGIVSHYEVSLSQNGKDWKKVAEGEFSNIKANPITQEISLPNPQNARFLRFKAKDVVDGQHVSIAELGVSGPNTAPQKQ